MRSNLHNVFEGLPGYKFMLDSDTPAIVVGPGGCRTMVDVPLMAGDQRLSTVAQLVFQPTDGVVISWWYRTEWHQDSLAHLLSGYPTDSWIEGWTPEAEKAILERKKHIG